MASSHSADDHIKKSEHDLEIAELMCKQDCYDWTIICAFYFAVHCVEAYAHIKGLERSLEKGLGDEESIHRKRERFVKQHLRKYFGTYRTLYDKSRSSRYDPLYFHRIKTTKDYHRRLLDKAVKIKNALN